MQAKLRVELVEMTPNPVAVLYTATRQCYAPGFTYDEYDKFYRDDLGYRLAFPDPAKENFIRKIIETGHESPLEHVSITFAIEGVSRSLTHQLCRTRIGFSMSQQSMRYVDETDFRYVIPKHIAKYPEIQKIMEDHMKASSDVYVKIKDMLLEKGHKRVASDEARSVLPQATETRIVFTMNCRSLLHFFELRCCDRASDEIQAMANKMLAICKEKLPCVFENAGAKCEKWKMCPEGPKFSCGKYPRIEVKDS